MWAKAHSPVGTKSLVFSTRLLFVNISFSECLPIKGLHYSIYKCDSKFETAAVIELLSVRPRYGVITLDGNACVMGIVCGPQTQVVASFSDDLPNRHRKGGQSSCRFQRLRLEKRAGYVAKAAEKADSVFLQEGLPIVAGLFLGGCAEFKDKLLDNLSGPLKSRHIASVVCAETGRAAFAEACAKCMPMISIADLAESEKCLDDFFHSLEIDDGKAVMGLREVLTCLEEGLVDTLIVSTDCERLHDGLRLAEWAEANYEHMTNKVTSRTAAGTRFLEYGGMAALLKFAVDPIIYTTPDDIEADI